MSNFGIKISAIVFMIILVPILGLSQESERLASISGIVEVINDSTNLFFSPPSVIDDYPHALPSTTIALLRSDSTVVIGTVSGHERGEYEIKDIKPGSYIIKAMYIGYETQIFSIEIYEGERLEKDIIVGQIYSPHQLPFGSNEAREDIKNGIIEIRNLPTVGCCIMCDEQTVQQKEELAKQLKQKYGFTERNVGNQFKEEYENNWEMLRQAIIRYNTTVHKHLAKINGDDWQERYKAELSKAEKELIEN